MMRQAILTAALLATAVPAVAQVRVVATTSSMAMLVREIGGHGGQHHDAGAARPGSALPAGAAEHDGGAPAR